MLISEAFEAFEIDELVSEGRSEKTVESYRGTCRSLLQSIGSDVDTALFMYSHVIAWKKSMHERNNSSAHMASQLREFRRVLTYLKSHGFATLDPTEIKIPKVTYKKTAWLTVDEVRQFLGVIDYPRDKALFASMFASGARISELLSLNRDSIVNGSAKIIGKGKVEGVLHFDDNALKLLNEYIESREDDLPYLFPSRQASPITGSKGRITVKQCIYLAHKYAKEAGINKRVTTHVLRHSFATNLELNGQDIRGMAIQMRHKKLETTKIYLHGEELRKLPDYEKYHTPVPID